jgi:hypothetical protein
VGRHGKRLVPVRIEEVATGDLPPELGAIQLLPSEGTFELDRHLGALLHTLRTDIEWIKEHTRLTEQARQWSNRGRGPAFILRGAELRGAQAWLEERKATSPAPAAAIVELILASRKAAARRRRWAIGGPLLALWVVGLVYQTIQYTRAPVMPDANIAMGDIENPATGDHGYELSWVACHLTCLWNRFPVRCAAFTYDKTVERVDPPDSTPPGGKAQVGDKRFSGRSVPPEGRRRCFPKYEASFYWNPSRAGSDPADSVLMPATSPPSQSRLLMLWYRALTGEPVDLTSLVAVVDSETMHTDVRTGSVWFGVDSGGECMKVCDALGERCAGFTYTLSPRRCEVFAKVSGVVRDAERRLPVYFSNAISACRDPKDCTATTQ